MASLVKRNYTASDGRTTILLEELFLAHLDKICERRKLSFNQIVAEIDGLRGRAPGTRRRSSGHNLASAIRVFVLDDLARRAERRDAVSEVSATPLPTYQKS
jgi:predicted DNA-binding ribbon-helix-helix protein